MTTASVLHYRWRPRHLALLLVVCVAIGSQPALAADTSSKVPPPFAPPERVSVLPVFFVPSDQKAPTNGDAHNLMKHLDWAERWYEKVLGGRDTFEIRKSRPYLYRAKRPRSYYSGQPKGSQIPSEVEELLKHLGMTRFNCPYVFVMVVSDPSGRSSLGQTLNGGINTGGGVVRIAASKISTQPNFQSALRHLLGLAFGLVHVDAYGLNMKTSASIMSYNTSFKTNGFKESRTPGSLVPEDIRALALNDRVFPKLRFDPKQDIPAGYTIRPKPKVYRPMGIAKQPRYAIDVVTHSGEANESRVSNVVLSPIKPNRPKGARPGDGFDAATMWHSELSSSGVASIAVTFPLEVTLTGVGVHSQHSGKYLRATAVRIEAFDGKAWRGVRSTPLASADQNVSLPATTSAKWRFYFKTDETGKVTIRGLRFFYKDQEIFPPPIPQVFWTKSF